MTGEKIGRISLVAAGALTVTMLAGTAAQAASGDDERRNPGMLRMHQLMQDGNPGMQRMHQLMQEGGGGMQGMNMDHGMR